MCQKPAWYSPQASRAHCFALGHLISTAICLIILGLAGGYVGVISGVLVIVGSSIVVGNCCTDPKCTFLTMMVLDIIAAILFFVASIIMFLAYHALKEAQLCKNPYDDDFMQQHYNNSGCSDVHTAINTYLNIFCKNSMRFPDIPIS